MGKYGILRFGVRHVNMLATPEIAQFSLGVFTFKAHFYANVGIVKSTPWQEGYHSMHDFLTFQVCLFWCKIRLYRLFYLND